MTRISVPVRSRKQSRYTDFWRLALTSMPTVYRLLAPGVDFRAVGILTSDAVGKFAQTRYTGFRRPKD